jgi:hypothetical protein
MAPNCAIASGCRDPNTGSAAKEGGALEGTPHNDERFAHIKYDR